jgi:TonB family protein
MEPLGSPYALVVEYKTGSGADATVAVNTREMPLTALHSFLADILNHRDDDNKAIFIKAARGRSYGELIALMDEVKGAGAEPLLLLIDEVAAPRQIKEPPPLPPGAIPGSVPGGVPGGISGGISDEPNIIRKSSAQLERIATRRVEPITPPLAKAIKLTGPVIVEVIIDEDGDVESARLLSGHPLLKDAAEAAARKWEFPPATSRGKPVKVIGTLRLRFK